MGTSYYYDENNDDNSTFLNYIYASNMTLKNYFGDLLFGGDHSRVIWSSNDYAFRKRVGTDNKNYSTANMPFVNLYMTDVLETTDDFIWNHIANIEGIFSSELGRKLKIVPTTIEYEATFWCRNKADRDVAIHRWMLDNSNETRLYPELQTWDGHNLPVSAKLGYDFQSNQYNENDWLEQNKIINLGFNPSLQLLLVYDSDGKSITITQTAVLNFISSNNLDHDDPMNSNPLNLITEYFSE